MSNRGFDECGFYGENNGPVGPTKEKTVDRDPVSWNYDRIHTAQAQIADVQNDMMRCLHKGEVHAGVRERMAKRLWSAAEDLRRLMVHHA